MPEATAASPDDSLSLPGFDWQPLEEAASVALARDWNLSLPDPPLDLASAVVSVAALPFYRDYRLVRVAAPRRTVDEPGAESQAVYLLYTPGDLRPLDSSLRSIDRVNLLSPLQLDAGNVAQYVALRLAFERSHATATPAPDGGMLLAVVEWAVDAAPGSGGRPEPVRSDEVFRLRIGLAVPGDKGWARLHAEVVVTPAGAVTLATVEAMPRRDDAAIEPRAALARNCVRIRPGCAWLAWHEADDTQRASLTGLLRGWISEPDQPPRIRIADLPFYRSYKLLELSGPGPRGWLRSYALVVPDATTSAAQPVVPLDGSSPPLHGINALADELRLDAQSVVPYLAFFCWAVQGEEGSFRIARSTWREIPLLQAPDDTQREGLARCEWGIRPTDPEEERSKGFPDRSEGEFRFHATVAYSNAVFRTWMAVSPSGMVTMLDDEPIVAQIPTRIEKFGSARLGIPRRLAAIGHRLLGTKPVDADWLLGSAAPDAATTHKQVTAREFVEALQREATLADLEVSDGPVEWAPPDASDRRPRLIRNCVFRHGLLAGHSASVAPVSLVHCLIEGGFSARGSDLKGAWLFVECRIGADKGNGSHEVAIDLDNASFADDVEFFACAVYGRLSGTSLRAQQHLRIRGCCFARAELDKARLVRVADIEAFTEPRSGFGSAQRFDNPPAIALPYARITGELEIGAATDETTRRIGGARSALVDGEAIATVVNGALDLSAITTDSLWLSGTVCDGYAALDYAVIGKELCMHSGGSGHHGAQFRTATGLSLASAHVGGSVSLDAAQVGHDLSLYLARIEGNLSLGGARIGENLNANFASVRGYLTAFLARDRITDHAVHLSVGKHLLMSGCDIRFCELRGVDIKGGLDIIAAKFERLMVAPAIERTGTHANGNPQYWIRPNRIGRVRVQTVTVSGNLLLAGILTADAGSTLRTGEERAGFSVRHSRIGGDLALALQGTPEADLVERFADKPGTIDWRRPDPAPDAPPAERGAIDASPLAKPRHEDVYTDVWGDLDLRANHVGGRLGLQNVTVAGQIHLNDTQVVLDVELNGDYTLDGASFSGLVTRCTCLDLEKLTCDGDVILTGLHLRCPPEDLEVAHIPVQRHGTLSARDMIVKGDLRFGPPGSDRPDPESQPLPMALIDGTIDLSGVRADRLVLSRRNLGKDGKVLLERGRFGRFDMIDPPPQSIELAGIQVGRWYFIHVGKDGRKCEPAPVAVIVDVLRKMPTFDRMAWIDIENGLRNEGRDLEANEVYVSMRRAARMREHEQRRLGEDKRDERRPVPDRLRYRWSRFKDQLKFLLTRYGTAVGRPMWPFLPVLLLSLWIFSNECNVAATTELLQVLGDKPALAASSCRPGPGSTTLPLAISPAQLGTPWRFTDAMALTVRYQVPIIGVLTHNRWEASARSLPGGFLSAEGYAFWVELYHWIAWPLFLIGVAARAFRGRRDG
ncbi:MAG: hypothetical protein BGO72_00870 [Burkholderiales bacterium 70-64]|nr:MAG: hypothetical protein BGO72_00870 [Burkholderiales bacterium 70-64]